MKQIIRNLIDTAAKESGCAVQFNGCPCNTCFHHWAEKKLHLHPEIAHKLWTVVLALRGDYEQKDLLDERG